MDNENAVFKYAKKIFGFAYSKTHNSYDAEDLSQEILYQILNKQTDFSDIENMDAYVYRICCYTWSNYFRKNKPAWNMLNFSQQLISSVPSDENIEKELIDSELFDKLRQEIMYLSRTRRDITIMYYYENKSGDEIAKILGIPSSTVRWHMSETKTILRERIEMTDTNMIYKPVKLTVGHNGWVQKYDMNGLASDLIMQNICVICRDKPLSTEEIARTLGIAAIYLEDKIDKLLYMDYLKECKKGRYQTTFYIRDTNYLIFGVRFEYENIMDFALPIYEIAKHCLPAVKKSNVLDGEFSDDFLMYSLVMMYASFFCGKLAEYIGKKSGIFWTRPKRKDGSEHFVCASFPFAIPDKIKADKDFYEYLMRSGSWGLKTRGGERASSLQCDQKEFGGWRVFEGDDLTRLIRVNEIAKSNEEPSDYDKEAIAIMCDKGYVRVENGKPIILVPMVNAPMVNFDKEKSKEIFNLENAETPDAELNSLLKGLYDRFDEFADRIIKERSEYAKSLPKSLDKNEFNYVTTQCCGFSESGVIYALHRNGYLYNPSEDEKKRICTLIFLN